MTLHKLYARKNSGGYGYLVRETLNNDQLIHSVMPNGRWIGNGLKYVELNKGSIVQSEQVENLYEYGTSPVNGNRIGRRYTDKSVCGYDLVFTPVKSVSILFGLSDNKIQNKVRECHEKAYKHAFEYLERIAETGTHVNNKYVKKPVDGLIAMTFEHWVSRSGDPNLHTHLVISNKVYTDNKWYALRGLPLYENQVVAGELYTAMLERLLIKEIGVKFRNREKDIRSTSTRNIPIMEIDGIDDKLIYLFSSRSNNIKDQYINSIENQNISGVSRYKMYQVVTLDTRPKKPVSKSFDEYVNQWKGKAKTLNIEELNSVKDRHNNYEEPYINIDSEKNTVIMNLSYNFLIWKSEYMYAEVIRNSRQVIRQKYTLDSIEQVINKVKEESIYIGNGYWTHEYVVNRDGEKLRNTRLYKEAKKRYELNKNDFKNSSRLEDKKIWLSGDIERLNNLKKELVDCKDKHYRLFEYQERHNLYIKTKDKLDERNLFTYKIRGNDRKKLINRLNRLNQYKDSEKYELNNVKRKIGDIENSIRSIGERIKLNKKIISDIEKSIVNHISKEEMKLYQFVEENDKHVLQKTLGMGMSM